MLYREPKLLKGHQSYYKRRSFQVSVLYREPKLLKGTAPLRGVARSQPVSVLYREPKLLKAVFAGVFSAIRDAVSVLYREPKLLKVKRREKRCRASQAFQCSTVSRNC